PRLVLAGRQNRPRLSPRSSPRPSLLHAARLERWRCFSAAAHQLRRLLRLFGPPDAFCASEVRCRHDDDRKPSAQAVAVFLRHPSGGRTMSAPDTPGAEARETVVFFWDSFGPMHVDRIAAVQAALHARARIIGVALRDRSDIYEWEFVEAGFER